MALDLWDRVDGRRPCGVCGRRRWCLRAKDESAAICTKVASDTFWAAADGYLHRLVETNRRAPVDECDWAAVVAAGRGRMTAARLAWVDSHLGLPAGSAAALTPGCDRDRWGDHLLWPMHDGRQRVCGVSKRYLTPDRDGVYRKISAGRNGLFLPVGWRGGSVVYLVEGASDAAALTAMGLAAVGRCSNTGGAEQLAELLANDYRQIVVVGENDQKGDGDWPGLYGGVATGNALRARLKRSVAVRLTPGGAKDAREYGRSLGFDGAAWEAAMRLDEVNTL